MHSAQDSSSFILLHEHSKVFKIIYTNCQGNVCPGNVCPGNVCPGKWLSGKRLVRKMIDELGHAVVRETSFRETSCPGIVLSGKCLVRESVRETSVTPLLVGVSQTLRRWTEGATYIRQGGHHVGHWPTFLVVCNSAKWRPIFEIFFIDRLGSKFLEKR